MPGKRGRNPRGLRTYQPVAPVTVAQLPFVRCSLCRNRKLFYKPDKTTGAQVLQTHVQKHHPEGR